MVKYCQKHPFSFLQLDLACLTLIVTFSASGNELSGTGIGASVGAGQYARDLIKLRAIIDESYKNFNPKPLLVAPGGFYNKEWYNKLLQVTGPQVVNAVTHHVYNLGAGGWTVNLLRSHYIF